MTRPAALDVQTDACTACRACEIACHFHHTGTFGAARRSVSIRLDGDTGSLQIGFDATCDGCPGESSPRCVAFCTPGALRLTA